MSNIVRWNGLNFMEMQTHAGQRQGCHELYALGYLQRIRL